MILPPPVSVSPCRGLMAWIVLSLLSGMAGCLPYDARQLNAVGDRAMAERRYEHAISSYSQSLGLAPGQPEVRHRLASAKVMLRQIYVDRIYDLVDARAGAETVAGFVKAWELSARLPQVDVAAARVASIRQDLEQRFARAEPRLRKSTERHRYYTALNRMMSLVSDDVVGKTRGEVSELLRRWHLKARDRATRKRRRGLALLHGVAAATFSARDTGLWSDARRRRATLLDQLAIPIRLEATAARGQSSRYLGGLRRRLPSIFTVKPGAALGLSLAAREPALEQRESRDRLNAQCKVGVRREPNPACPSLKRRVDQAARDLEASRRALSAAAERCSGESQASSCTSHIRDAERNLRREQDDYRRLESEASRCQSTVEVPVHKIFFYERRTLMRQATVSGALSLSRGSEVLSSRAVQGSASASDQYGGGLSCAGIPPDPLSIPGMPSLLSTASERMLDGCTGELRRMQREKAEAQLGGKDREADRLDALVRARLVDPSYAAPAQQLKRHLAANWGSDFNLVEAILR